MPDSKVRAGERSVRDYLRIPQRFLRSIHLERDFNDPAALTDYVVTPPMVEAFQRVLDGLRPGSGRRAWRITGDYGSGKSSFALVLAHVLGNPESPALADIRQSIGVPGTACSASMVPVLVTGAREGIVQAVARAVISTIGRLEAAAGRGRSRPKGLLSLVGAAEDAAARNDASDLVSTLNGLAAYVTGAGHGGVLLVIDELGKLLEYAAVHPERADVYVLQQLAEAASRSGERPLVLLGLLHQGFSAYSERLPAPARNEWEKVAGRFEEIVFDQPLAHTSALIAGALRVRAEELPSALREEAEAIREECNGTLWATGSEGLDPLASYPLHPTLIPVLVGFFARYGQHERSLFSFLLSSEPFGLQWFAERPARAGSWYRLPEFYDYVRATFGHRVTTGSQRTQWSRVLGLMDGLRDVDEAEARVLKTIAVLNLLDADHLLATDALIEISALRDRVIGSQAKSRVPPAIDRLKRKGAVYNRGAAGGYRLWPNTSVNLEGAYAAAERALGRTEDVARHIRQYLDHSPLLARRHYIETGTLRHFEVRYATAGELEHTVAVPTEADGVVVVALCNTLAEQLLAEGISTSAAMAPRHNVIVAVPGALVGLASDLDEVRRWTWVEQNTPELTNDAYAATEVSRQIASARRSLMSKVSQVISFRGGQAAAATTWTVAGATIEVSKERGLLAVLSSICDDLYDQAPLIRNELLNRRMPSGSAIGARTRLIERMFVAGDQPALGLDTSKAPPERALYLSVLDAGAVHTAVDGAYAIRIPGHHDPLRLRPALRQVLRELESADGARVPVSRLLSILEERPYGVRAGLSYLFLAIMSIAHAHEIAVYENGTFLRKFGPPEFLRLTKVPTAFELQLCRVAGVRAEVFESLVEVFASRRAHGRPAELLDVVTPLCQYAASLPEYTRRSVHLPAAAARVRDVLLNAREPGTLLFHDLPIACGYTPFATEGTPDRVAVQSFVASLREALDELKAAYPQLLERIRGVLSHVLAGSGKPLDRIEISTRATRAVLAAREPRIRTFCIRLSDQGLRDDDRWTEALAGFVLSKPPAKWAGADEARCSDELSVLASAFLRLESLALVMHDADGAEERGRSVRVGVTGSNGSELERIIRFPEAEMPLIDEAVRRLSTMLPPERAIRVAALVRLLETELEAASGVTT